MCVRGRKVQKGWKADRREEYLLLLLLYYNN